MNITRSSKPSRLNNPNPNRDPKPNLKLNYTLNFKTMS